MSNMQDYVVQKPWGHEIRFAENESIWEKFCTLLKATGCLGNIMN